MVLLCSVLLLQLVLFVVFQLWVINRGGMFIVLFLLTLIFSFVIVYCYEHWIRYFYPLFVLITWILALYVIQGFGGCEDGLLCSAWFELKDYVVAISAIGCASGCVVLALKEIFRKK